MSRGLRPRILSYLHVFMNSGFINVSYVSLLNCILRETVTTRSLIYNAAEFITKFFSKYLM